MKLDLWYFFLFCFQVEVLTGEINVSTSFEMFTFHNGGVQILCKCPESVRQFKMQLLKGTQVICDVSKTDGNGNAASTQNQKFCQLSNYSVSLFMNNLDSSLDSYYYCKLLIFDPPPFQEILHKEYLHVRESQLCCQLKFWLPVGCAAFVAIYSFACIFLCWFTKKKYKSSVHDPNSEYMFMAAVNTAKKPGFTDVTRNLGLSGTRA
ncbi:inducible T-cell costimulator isoform X1 [Saccopteryx leptura]|uniref:inducible T-cell costimulator isoform X1 n=1 Tax=Saccopteryx leptura TaxID=249018 RepID=UPI00339C40B5